MQTGHVRQRNGEVKACVSLLDLRVILSNTDTCANKEMYHV